MGFRFDMSCRRDIEQHLLVVDSRKARARDILIVLAHRKRFPNPKSILLRYSESMGHESSPASSEL